MSDQKFPVEQMWRDWFMTDAFKVEKQWYRAFRLLPHDPRCKICNSPFHGMGGFVMRSLGRKQSSLNPNFCSICEDFARKFPGGAEVEMAMLFADVRGSTSLSEQMTAIEFQKLINRFYVGATHEIAGEDGLVEKLAGDAVAAFWGAGFAGKRLCGQDNPRRAEHRPADAKTEHPGGHRRPCRGGLFRRHGLL